MKFQARRVQGQSGDQGALGVAFHAITAFKCAQKDSGRLAVSWAVVEGINDKGQAD